MGDDYLFDGTGEPDRDVEQLEQMLGQLRGSRRPAPQIPVVSGFSRTVERKTYVGVRFLGPALAMAAAIVLMVGLAWHSVPTDNASWEVATVIGTPRIDASVLMGEGRLAIG